MHCDYIISLFPISTISESSCKCSSSLVTGECSHIGGFLQFGCRCAKSMRNGTHVSLLSRSTLRNQFVDYNSNSPFPK